MHPIPRVLSKRGHRRPPSALFLSFLAFALGSPEGAAAQAGGDITGVVEHVDDGSPVAQARVDVLGAGIGTFTDDDGRFRLQGVPEGAQVLTVGWLYPGVQRVYVEVPPAGSIDIRIAYRSVPFDLNEIIVTGPSRVPQRVVEAPVAVAVVERGQSRNYSTTGQHPQVIRGLTGMDVSSNGMHDFNVNTRGFNADLSQRLLVLMDGRDLAIPFLAAQEWSALSVPLEDMERIEVARGPGAALYGANAYNGVINIITPAPRDVVGSKIALAGGELATLRGDIRHARVFGSDGRFGLRANLGYYRSDDWHQSRTNLDDLASEYGASVDVTEFPVNTPPPGFEVTPLNGQQIASLPGPASGKPDPVENVYGSARLDYYHTNGAVGTVEGGAARASNQLFMTNVGRFQVDEAWRPWARAAWADERFNFMAYYSGRSSDQHSLASGAPIEEKSSTFHLESQWNASVLDDRLQAVVGASYRRSLVDSRGTLVAPIDDARNDWYGGGFGQLSFEITPELTLVLAGRQDDSNLFDPEFSPKAALVFAPTLNHSFRVTAGRAYQTPRMTNFFLNVPLGLPADLTALESAMRTAFAPALDPVPVGTLFTQSNMVPALALGNPNLDVEHVTSYEAGYRGEFDRRVQLSVDGFYSVVRDFVSALLPYANSAYGPWTAPQAVDPSVRGALEGAVLGALGAGSGLTRLNDATGTTAVVYSYGNAGRATNWGIEVGVGLEVSPRVHLVSNYSFFDYTVDEGVPLVPGDLIVPNTPRHKGNLRADYTGQRFDVWAGLTFTTEHDWSSGFFQGRIPSSQKIDAGLGYIISRNLRVHAIATNLFDQATYQIYGGSIDRRRVLMGVTAYF